MTGQQPNKPCGIEFSNADYEEFGEFLQQTCGIELGAGKEYLVATRVRRILVKEHISTVKKLLERLKKPNNHSLRQDVIDAMTTNETLWFRDAYPFDYIKNVVLADVNNQRIQQFRIWSAACSSGQEPYSLSMTINEFNRERPGQLPISTRITATDISSEILAIAKEGIYDRLSIARGLSQQRLQTYFGSTADGRWQVKPYIQDSVEFKPLNLRSDHFGFDQYHMIFCRNVLIYFNFDLKRQILRKMHSVLASKGILFLGASESVSGAEELFEVINCNPGIAYRKRD
jgi:chemotaxis protein methyltransferase CheR